MQDRKTGLMKELDADTHGILSRFFEAGKVTAPLFAVGEKLEIKNGLFRVVALDRHLMVLEGLPSEEASLKAP